MTALHLYVGPTSFGVDLPTQVPDGCRLHPPVRRGDLPQLLREEDRGVVAIVDGTFHAYPAVGHAEIRAAVAAGWEVWGLSSMGAIRASEMVDLGMRGYGVVYEAFRSDPRLADDEVALLHQEDAPFRPLSEPLFHLRRIVQDCLAAGAIGPSDADAIVDMMRNRWYAERTLPLLWQALHDAGVDLAWIESARSRLPTYRQKSIDLVAFLHEHPWA